MRLGKDFWKILNVFRWIANILEIIAKDVNTDTPAGQEQDPTA